MPITTTTRDKVARVLQERGVGRGLTIPQLRRLYPAKAVRRIAVLEALADLGAMGLVEWNGKRVRWCSAHFDVERVMGERVDRVERARRVAPEDRIIRASELSSAFVEANA